MRGAKIMAVQIIEAEPMALEAAQMYVTSASSGHALIPSLISYQLLIAAPAYLIAGLML
jgi:hypothetical protein